MALDLADHGRGRVRRELDAAFGVEAVDGLDQADGADLQQVVVRLAAVAEPPGEMLHEREMQGDQLVADALTLGGQRWVAVRQLSRDLVEPTEQLAARGPLLLSGSQRDVVVVRGEQRLGGGSHADPPPRRLRRRR